MSRRNTLDLPKTCGLSYAELFRPSLRIFDIPKFTDTPNNDFLKPELRVLSGLESIDRSKDSQTMLVESQALARSARAIQSAWRAVNPLNLSRQDQAVLHNVSQFWSELLGRDLSLKTSDALDQCIEVKLPFLLEWLTYSPLLQQRGEFFVLRVRLP